MCCYWIALGKHPTFSLLRYTICQSYISSQSSFLPCLLEMILALQSYINAGHRRGKILFAKLVVHQIACMVILSFPLLLHSIIGTFVTKGALASIGIVVMVIASQFAMCLLPFFFAFIFRDIGKSMAVPMVLFFLMVFLMNGDQVQLISQILPMGQLRLMALQQSNISGGQFMFSDFLWVLALCLGTYLWFRRSDLK